MDNYYSVVSKILNLASKQNFVQEVHYGDAIDWLGSGDHKYCSFCVVEQPNNQFGDQFNIFNFVLYIVDRLEEDNSNLLEVHSNTKTIGEHLLRMMPDDWTIVNQSFTPFKYKFADLCAGNYVTISLQVPVEFVCEDDAWEPIILKIDKNGMHNVNGYDSVDVNVSAAGAIDYYWIMPHNYGAPSQITYSDIKTTLEIKFRLKSTVNQSIYDDGYTSLIYEDNQYKARLNGGEWKDTFIREPDIPETKTVKLTGTRLQIGYYLFDLEDGGHKWSYGQHLYIGKGENVGDIDIYYCKLYWDKGDFADYEPFIEKGETVLKDTVSGNVLSIKKVSVVLFEKIKPMSISWKNDNKVTNVPGEMMDTSDMTSFDSMFENCRMLENVDVSEWNTSNVTSIARTFVFCTSLKELDVSKWDTSNVTSLRFTFYNCTSLTKPLDVSKWNTSKVTDLYNTFASQAGDTLDVSKWDVSNVTTMQSVFYGCSAVTTLDLTGWNCEKNKNATYFFHNDRKLVSVIGTHTLAEVETGNIVALKNNGAACSELEYQGASVLRYSSILALVNGMYDRTSTAIGKLRLATAAFNACKNDDDTLPDTATLAERQAKIRSICAEKNYNLILG